MARVRLYVAGALDGEPVAGIHDAAGFVAGSANWNNHYVQLSLTSIEQPEQVPRSLLPIETADYLHNATNLFEYTYPDEQTHYLYDTWRGGSRISALLLASPEEISHDHIFTDGVYRYGYLSHRLPESPDVSTLVDKRNEVILQRSAGTAGWLTVAAVCETDRALAQRTMLDKTALHNHETLTFRPAQQIFDQLVRTAVELFEV